MWKCASNCFRLPLAKGLLKDGKALTTKVRTPVKDCSCLLNFTPILKERIARYYGFYKTSCGKFSKEKKNKENPNGKDTSFLDGFNHNVSDALTWSAVFVLGYYFLQPFRKSKRTTNVNGYDCTNCSVLSGYQTTVKNYLIDSFRLRPINYVLPEVKAAKTKHKKEPSISLTQSQELQVNEQVDRLESAHLKVLGVLNNWIGVQHMQSGNHTEGLECFIQSADEDNPSGIFNLAICHEKGLGTSQNFKRAAELYQRATDLGHPSAMYNLGVFYAQGLGGVQVNADRARELFERAARLGQKDAENALNLEFSPVVADAGPPATHSPTEPDLTESIPRSWLSESIRETTTKLIETFKFVLDEANPGVDSFGDSDSGVLDLSPHVETDELNV